MTELLRANALHDDEDHGTDLECKKLYVYEIDT